MFRARREAAASSGIGVLATIRLTAQEGLRGRRARARDKAGEGVPASNRATTLDFETRNPATLVPLRWAYESSNRNTLREQKRACRIGYLSPPPSPRVAISARPNPLHDYGLTSLGTRRRTRRVTSALPATELRCARAKARSHPHVRDSRQTHGHHTFEKRRICPL